MLLMAVPVLFAQLKGWQAVEGRGALYNLGRAAGFGLKRTGIPIEYYGLLYAFALLLVVFGVVFAVRNPDRSLQDRISGTYLVPK